MPARPSRLLAAAALTALVAACSSWEPARRAPPLPATPQTAPSRPAGPDTMALVPASFADLPGWRADDAAAVLPALKRTCDRLTRLPPDRSIGQDGIGGTVADWFSPCSAAARIAPGDADSARQMFEGWFAPYLVVNNGLADGLFTGYFEPELNGSRSRQGRFTVPILGKPRDLVSRSRPGGEAEIGRISGDRLVPYPSRAEIEAGALGSLAPPLAWVDDAVDAHILHIQGSGRIRLDDGTIIHVGVAGTNGQKFIGIGKILRDRGLISDSSMPGVRAWLKAHPNEAGALMAENPRYVFYRIVTGDGPIGTEGVALTPGRSLAVDTRFLALGLPVFLDSVDPDGQPLRRLMMAQDTGSAIKGPVRGDFFWGAGDDAFDKAGRMKSAGRYWVLLPQTRSPRIAVNR